MAHDAAFSADACPHKPPCAAVIARIRNANRRGKICELADKGQRLRLCAGTIERLLSGGDRPRSKALVDHHSSVRVQRACIEGALNLELLANGRGLQLIDCVILGDINVEQASLHSLYVERTIIYGSVRGRQLHCSAGVWLCQLLVDDVIDLTGARIDGDLHCEGTIVHGHESAIPSFIADRLWCGGSVLLTRAADRGKATGGLFRSSGGVSIANAHVKGTIDIRDATLLRMTSRPPLTLPLTVDALPTAERGLDYPCALCLDLTSCEGSILLEGMHAYGDVRLLRCQIRGQLLASYCYVEGWLRCNALQCDDVAVLSQAFVLGGISFAGASVKQRLEISEGSKIGALNLRSATVGMYIDDQDSRPTPGGLALDGFVYEMIKDRDFTRDYDPDRSGASDASHVVNGHLTSYTDTTDAELEFAARIAWIELQNKPERSLRQRIRALAKQRSLPRPRPQNLGHLVHLTRVRVAAKLNDILQRMEHRWRNVAARIISLRDDVARLSAIAFMLRLRAFLGPARARAQSPLDVRWTDWLGAGIYEFRPGPFTVLAKFLDRRGRHKMAEDTKYFRSERYARQPGLPVWRRLVAFVHWAISGYGYKRVRAMSLIFLLPITYGAMRDTSVEYERASGSWTVSIGDYPMHCISAVPPSTCPGIGASSLDEYLEAASFGWRWYWSAASEITPLPGTSSPEPVAQATSKAREDAPPSVLQVFFSGAMALFVAIFVSAVQRFWEGDN